MAALPLYIACCTKVVVWRTPDFDRRCWTMVERLLSYSFWALDDYDPSNDAVVNVAGLCMIVCTLKISKVSKHLHKIDVLLDVSLKPSRLQTVPSWSLRFPPLPCNLATFKMRFGRINPVCHRLVLCGWGWGRRGGRRGRSFASRRFAIHLGGTWPKEQGSMILEN